jgi:hypothetical protein
MPAHVRTRVSTHCVIAREVSIGCQHTYARASVHTATRCARSSHLQELVETSEPLEVVGVHGVNAHLRKSVTLHLCSTNAVVQHTLSRAQPLEEAGVVSHQPPRRELEVSATRCSIFVGCLASDEIIHIVLSLKHGDVQGAHDALLFVQRGHALCEQPLHRFAASVC